MNNNNPEERTYLLCICGKNGDDMWTLLRGRTSAYELIKNEIDNIDLEESFILVESAKLCNRKSIYAFMKHVEQFYQDSFDIEDYVSGDWIVDDYDEKETVNDIDASLNIDEPKLNMIDFMNGNIGSSSINEEGGN